jgi:hypothetical protein
VSDLKLKITLPESKLDDCLSDTGRAIYYWAEECRLDANLRGYVVVRAHLAKGTKKERTHTLSRRKFKVAVEALAVHYTHHFASIMTGDCGDETNDALVQMAALEDVLFG